MDNKTVVLVTINYKPLMKTIFNNVINHFHKRYWHIAYMNKTVIEYRISKLSRYKQWETMLQSYGVHNAVSPTPLSDVYREPTVSYKVYDDHTGFMIYGVKKGIVTDRHYYIMYIRI